MTLTAAGSSSGQTSLTELLLLLLLVVPAATVAAVSRHCGRVAAVSLVAAGVQAAARGLQLQLVVCQAQVSERRCCCCCAQQGRGHCFLRCCVYECVHCSSKGELV